ncbi:regulator of G-protein signaling 7-like [Centruroides vittatus]|uniref:regulator of G-protein signaling 7-like n=1 Tax=Centruroides vittatus TaxID=120091 RepID=UPI00350FACB6
MTLGVNRKKMDHTHTDESPKDLVFEKMEALIQKMQHPETGVPVRSKRQFLTSIPCAFQGYDLVEWLVDNLDLDDMEALHLANQLCFYGYFFPVNDTKSFIVKDDGTFYRFQTPYFWPSHHRPNNTDYAIYLVKKSLRSKQKNSLEDYEQESLAQLKKFLCHKWDFICKQAEEQLNLTKERRKADKIIMESQEKAYWRVHRPPPGHVSCMDRCPIPNKRTRKRKSLEDLISKLKHVPRTRVKVSQAIESLFNRWQQYAEHDPFFSSGQINNPWIMDDPNFWKLNASLVEIPLEKRIRRWAISLRELLSDPTGVRQFENYLRKEYSHENIVFWKEVQALKRGSQRNMKEKVQRIYNEFIAPNSPMEVNLDSKTHETIIETMKNPTRYTFDSAQEHVFALMEKDTYPRFLRSDDYKNLLHTARQTSHKKRLFIFGSITRKKGSPDTTPTTKRRSNAAQISGSSVDLTHMSRALETEGWPFSGRHSHSTSDLHDLDLPSDKMTSSRLSSPSGSRELLTDPAAHSTLQVPSVGHKSSEDSGSEDDSQNLTLPVPSVASVGSPLASPDSQA